MTNIKMNVSGDTIDFRTGQLPEPINGKKSWEMSGIITSPLTFLLAANKPEIKKETSFLIICREDRTIKFMVNEDTERGNRWDYVITGKLNEAEWENRLAVNKDVWYDTRDLALKLKRCVDMFDNLDDHAMLITQLRKLEAKVETTVKDSDDFRGNKEKAYKQVLTGVDIPRIVLHVPLFKGMGKVSVELSAEFDYQNGGVVCTLISPELVKLKERFLDDRIAESAETFSDGGITVFYQ